MRMKQGRSKVIRKHRISAEPVCPKIRHIYRKIVPFVRLGKLASLANQHVNPEKNAAGRLFLTNFYLFCMFTLLTCAEKTSKVGVAHKISRALTRAVYYIAPWAPLLSILDPPLTQVFSTRSGCIYIPCMLHMRNQSASHVILHRVGLVFFSLRSETKNGRS